MTAIDPREALAFYLEERMNAGPTIPTPRRPTPTSSAKATLRLKACTNCTLHVDSSKVLPQTTDNADLSDCRFAILGPFERHDYKWDVAGMNKPFMEAMLRRIGFGYAGAWGTVVGCKTDERPNMEQTVACEGHVQRWLTHLDGRLRKMPAPIPVLLVGAVAKDQWRPDCAMDRVAGQVGVWEAGGVARLAMVVKDPRSIMEAPNKSWLISEFLDCMETWKAVLSSWATGDATALLAKMGRACQGCGSVKVSWIDPDGIGFCRSCIDKDLRVVERWELVRTERAKVKAKMDRVQANVAMFDVPVPDPSTVDRSTGRKGRVKG